MTSERRSLAPLGGVTAQVPLVLARPPLTSRSTRSPAGVRGRTRRVVFGPGVVGLAASWVRSLLDHREERGLDQFSDRAREAQIAPGVGGAELTLSAAASDHRTEPLQ